MGNFRDNLRNRRLQLLMSQDELAKNSDLLRTKAKQNAILAIDLLKK